MVKPISMSKEEYNARLRAKRAANRDEANAKRREYYRANAKRLAAHCRRWEKKNLERKRANRRRWYNDNEEHKAKQREWHRANRERMNECGRKSYHKNKERTQPARIARIQRRRAWKMGAGGSFTPPDIEKLFDQQLGSCAGCARSFTDVLPVTVDHIVPLSRGGSNWPGNLQLMCGPCNDSKGARTMDEWLDTYLEAA